MKKQILVLLIAVTTTAGSYAQCDKKVVLTSSKTEYLNTDNTVQRTVDEQTTVEYDSKAITITPGDHTMDGTISSITCDWKTAFKEGKTVIKTTLNGEGGRTMTGTLTIEGKDGKLYLTAEFEEMPDTKIRVTVDSFEEKK